MSAYLPRPRRLVATIGAATCLALALPLSAASEQFDHQGPPVPRLLVTQKPAAQTVRTGGTPQFVISVANTGHVALKDVSVTSAATPACNRDASALPALGLIAVGHRVTYQCDDAARFSDYTNRVVAAGSGADGRTAEDWADALVDVVEPSISLRKDATEGVVSSGETATFTLSVHNDGEMELMDVVVSDPLVPSCDRTFAFLAVDAVQSWTCELPNVTADVTNVAAVSAQPALRKHAVGDRVDDGDQADVTVRAPSIDIVKRASTDLIRDAGPVTFEITVTNDGNTPLAGVVVADAATPACDRTIGDLAPTDSVTYSCVVEALTSSLTNEAIAIGRPEVGEPVTASDTAVVEVIHPAISIVKTVADDTVEPGDAAIFTIVVSNPGDTPLSAVVVTDAATPSCDRSIGDLAAGATLSYSCSALAVAADFTNVAVVSGAPRLGPAVTATDSVDVDAVTPAVLLAKIAASRSIDRGGDATFRLTVTNSGDTALTEVTIVDDATPSCDRTFATLAVGASETWTCTAEKVVADLVNVAGVTAISPDGHPVTDSAQDRVSVTTVLSTSTSSTAAAASLAVTGGNPTGALWWSGLLLGVGGLLRRRSRTVSSQGD